ncbi:16S rRNA (adenine(1518)-N(6)/adenine(1519)-N(6))-dimethyltransferase RsmA [Candidatus Synechococcus calcipolaris G9]|uniref:Ribosomal RNA small subunit methyltransferase A n=1 Tax=Candidatus Synechococcus calcipolaris G9 TaxID=1497997 RepID=A0ABT6F1N4_9SYNE|nr:16S rRNA (adenine(1518)-N(6)/adenine(1519)-N(6))-dimethyltransferase RsmA [Candidatus Synechococcus calcipolaris]MDG2991742.1 16S rRNA (adenine(1518)-N(6)/adenine(1519)-N(6))-dimethyltransferase RsmA [Candidatus Synechococcus calcipolaris G9]
MRPRKQLGQHWLRSPRVLGEILGAADLSGGDRILEIGPGTGVLTKPLLAQAQEVVSVELDPRAYGTLTKTLTQPNLHLIQGDILELDLDTLPRGCPDKVVANIPYNITGPILMKLLGTMDAPRRPPFERLILLVQREVADRLTAQPSSRAFGALSLRVQYLATCELICPVPATAFHPVPKVASAVIRLRPHATLPTVKDPRWLDHLIKQGFSTRRKMLATALKPILNPDLVRHCLESLGISIKCRGEDLNLDQWIQLSDVLEPN